MYFLRRRHGRKPPPEARREVPQPEAPARYEAPEPGHEASPSPTPKVITKPPRHRIEPESEAGCKPAGTFRAGTLHIDRSQPAEASHGKM